MPLTSARNSSNVPRVIESEREPMPNTFAHRFDLDVGVGEAKKRFVNRVYNEIMYDFLLGHYLLDDNRDFMSRAVATYLGDRYEQTAVVNFIGDDFLRNLHAIEAIHDTLGNMSKHSGQKALSEIVVKLLASSERDLGISWQDGKFYPSGAKALDEKLVNDVMKWLREKKYATVLAPFEKGLGHLLESSKRPELTGDVVTDMYEALEALAKIVTRRETKDLSANQEVFIAEVNTSLSYKKLLRDYIEYAHEFRHAAVQKSPRPPISVREAESFTYLTGMFIRLAIS